MYRTKHALFGALGMLLALSGMPATASATSTSGQIIALRVSSGTSASRLSVRIAGNTACSLNGWYAFENADSGIGKTWYEALLAAHMNRRSIQIFGEGTCDGYGVEKIAYIDINN